MIRNLDQLVAYAKGLGATHMTLSNYHRGGLWKLRNDGHLVHAETIRWATTLKYDGYEVDDIQWVWSSERDCYDMHGAQWVSSAPFESVPPSMIEIGSVLTDEHFLRSNELIGGELGNLTQT